MNLGEKVPIKKKFIKDGNNNILVSGVGWYDKKIKAKKRHLLEINIENVNKNKSLNVIMLNPSEYGKERKDLFVDSTITNVIKIAKDNGYNIINILNLFSEIQSDSNEVNFKNIDAENIDKVIQYINKNKEDIFIAWGYRFKFNTRKDKIVELLRNLKNKQVFVLNNELTYPKHPGRMSIDLIRKKYGNGQKVKLKKYLKQHS